MKIAVMQPYIFPYIGYFQLINAADAFVFYNDVNFIKQGWVNRNRILLNNKEFLFSVPIRNISQNIKINETEIALREYNSWKAKFLKTIHSTYSNAPFYREIAELVSYSLSTDTIYIADLAIQSIKNVCEYLNLTKRFYISSLDFADTLDDVRADRLINICHKLNAGEYINAIGGKELYSKDIFNKHNIDLHFLKSRTIHYRQHSDVFIPWLSIIDVLMFNSVSAIKIFLDEYELE